MIHIPKVHEACFQIKTDVNMTKMIGTTASNTKSVTRAVAMAASCRVKSRQKKDEKEARANHTHALGGTYVSFREST
jgi:hypothetical protein